MKKGDGAVRAGHQDRRDWKAQRWEGRTCLEGTRMENTNTNQSGRERGHTLCRKERGKGNWEQKLRRNPGGKAGYVQ